MLNLLFDEYPRLHETIRRATLNVHQVAVVDRIREARDGVAVEAFVMQRRLLLPLS